MSKTVTILDEFKINYLTQAQYDAEVAGGTVQPDELYLTPSADYSTSEVNTGKKWIDGKPIYRQTIVEPDVSASVSGNRATYEHEMSLSADTLISGFGIVTFQDGTYAGRKYCMPCMSHMSSSCTVQVGGGFAQKGTGNILALFYIDDTTVYAQTKVDMTLTLYYTKS